MSNSQTDLSKSSKSTYSRIKSDLPKVNLSIASDENENKSEYSDSF